MKLGFPYFLLAIALLLDAVTWQQVSVADRSTHITLLLAAAAIIVAIQGWSAPRKQAGSPEISKQGRQ